MSPDLEKLQFTVSGRVLLFAEGSDSESIGFWGHNQNFDALYSDALYSDALFPDVPEPVASIPLAPDTFKVTESEFEGDGNVDGRRQQGTFQDHALKIQIADVNHDEGFTLKGFTVDTSVFVKVGP